VLADDAFPRRERRELVLLHVEMLEAWPVTRADPPQLADAETAAAVRRVFDEAGYNAPTIQERLGTTDRALAEGPDRPVYLRRLGDGDAIGVLVRLFLLDVAVARETAERVLGPETLGLLRDVGLLTPDHDTSDATVRIVPHEHLLVASDRIAAGHADHVAAVHGPSATLSHLTVRRRVARALDVGTGTGIQALLAAAHADRGTSSCAAAASSSRWPANRSISWSRIRPT
jgi:hypothetical protein